MKATIFILIIIAIYGIFAPFKCFSEMDDADRINVLRNIVSKKWYIKRRIRRYNKALDYWGVYNKKYCVPLYDGDMYAYEHQIIYNRNRRKCLIKKHWYEKKLKEINNI